MVSSRQLGVAPHAAHDRGEGPAKSGLHVGTTLSAVIVLQIMSAFGIQWYTVAHLGVGAQADALYAGGTLPQIATAFLMEPLGFVLIPFLSSKTEADRDRAGWPLLCAIAAVSSIVALLLFLVAPIAVPLLAPGLAASTAALTVELAQIQAVGVIGAGCGIVLMSLSQAKGRFVWPALTVLLCTCGGWGLLVVGLDGECSWLPGYKSRSLPALCCCNCRCLPGWHRVLSPIFRCSRRMCGGGCGRLSPVLRTTAQGLSSIGFLPRFSPLEASPFWTWCCGFIRQ